MIDTNEKFQKIEELTNSGYNLNISKYIGEAFEIFKKNAGGFIVFTLLTFAISFVMRWVPFHLGFLVSLVISAPLNVGFGIVARKIKYNEPYSFGDFFKGFDKFGDLFVVYICSLIFIAIGFILLVIPGIYLAVSYFFAYYFVWFLNDTGVMNPLERSRKLVSKEWFSFFGFLIVILLLNIAGAICLGVGLLVSLPVSSIAIYVCFEDLIGTEDATEVSANNVATT